LGSQLRFVREARFHCYQRWSDVAGEITAFDLVAGQAVTFFAIKGNLFTLLCYRGIFCKSQLGGEAQGTEDGS